MFLSRLKESKYATLILASIFAFTLFLQCCFFHYQAFHSILISSLWNDPITFLTFYAPKISISLFIASFVFLFKRKSWIIYFSFIISLWIIAELIYFRANGIFLDSYSFTMIGNMDGFWSSVPMYFYFADVVVFIPPIIVVMFYIMWSKSLHPYKVGGLIFLFLSILGQVISVFGLNIMYKKYKFDHDDLRIIYFNPLNNDSVRSFWGFTCIDYLRQTSPIHAIIYETKNLLLLPFTNDTYLLNNNEKLAISKFITSNTLNNKIENRLIIILVESLENWAVSKHATPNIYNFIKDNENIFYHSQIITQVKGGTSADGQMIVNTGLLPIKEGATCFRFPGNTYPALSKLYKKPLGIIPGNAGVWNQGRMSEAYGISSMIYEPMSNDSLVFSILTKNYQQCDYILSITMASHSPFKAYADKSDLILPNDMPMKMANYLKCISYTDNHLNQFLSAIKSDSILKNSTIVITGDHTIFPSEIRKEFSDYCKTNNLDYKIEEAYCPLIIYSPNIKEKTIVDEEAYQMDIYPTILHVIGAEDYYWKGFGVNLLDSVARRNRLISPEDAFELSDKLIRANYFKEIESQLSNN